MLKRGNATADPTDIDERLAASALTEQLVAESIEQHGCRTQWCTNAPVGTRKF